MITSTIRKAIAALALGLLASPPITGQVVPVIYDLTTLGSSAVINGATFTQVATQPAGLGVIDPFVQIRGASQEHAYNTTVNGVLDNTNSNTKNHAIQVSPALGAGGFFDIGDNMVMRFLLNINELNSATKRLLNLDDVQIFVFTIANQSVTSFTGGLLDLSNASLVYQMDDDGDNTVVLDDNNTSSPSETDMTLDISKSMFDASLLNLGMTTAADKNNAYVYLYSAFGSRPNINDGNYEEWARQDTGSGYSDTPTGGTIPEPSSGSMVLQAIGLLGVSVWVRRKRS